MKLRIYSIFDLKAEEFSPPFFQKNDRLAMRTVTESAQGPTSMLQNYPDDFILYRLGDFDNETGVIIIEQKPHMLMNVANLMSRRNTNNAENS